MLGLTLGAGMTAVWHPPSARGPTHRADLARRGFRKVRVTVDLRFARRQRKVKAGGAYTHRAVDPSSVTPYAEWRCIVGKAKGLGSCSGRRSAGGFIADVPGRGARGDVRAALHRRKPAKRWYRATGDPIVMIWGRRALGPGARCQSPKRSRTRMPLLSVRQFRRARGPSHSSS
jgi:hypothetical protein